MYSLCNCVKLYKPLQIWRLIPGNVAACCLGAHMHSFEQFACSCLWECSGHAEAAKPTTGYIHPTLAFSTPCKGTPHCPNCVLIWWGHFCLIRPKASWRPSGTLTGSSEWLSSESLRALQMLLSGSSKAQPWRLTCKRVRWTELSRELGKRPPRLSCPGLSVTAVHSGPYLPPPSCWLASLCILLSVQILFILLRCGTPSFYDVEPSFVSRILSYAWYVIIPINDPAFPFLKCTLFFVIVPDGS